jgi:hypothetical protein
MIAGPGLGQDELVGGWLEDLPEAGGTGTPWWQRTADFWSSIAGKYILRPAPGTAIRTPGGGIYVRQPEGVRQPTSNCNPGNGVGSRVGAGGSLILVAGIGIVALVLLARKR